MTDFSDASSTTLSNRQRVHPKRLSASAQAASIAASALSR